MDEDMEERFLRHQKLMRNRYSKLLRRRSIWEGSEHTQSPVWARSRRWLVTRWADKKALSYQRALQAGMQDPARRTNDERPWKEWDRDFDKLKFRIDEEIDRDPYGALFGRHVRGPPSPNNSSWTSFSWIYGPLKSMQKGVSSISPDGTPDLTVGTVTAMKPNERKTFSVPPRAPSSQSNRMSQTEPEYEFDPISMRKVPKQNEASLNRVQPNSAEPSLQTPKKAFLETLFSEHGVDIPVKTYKPHKVYGHRGFEPATANTTRAAASPKPKPSGIDLENSRLRDLQALKFKTLGNSIDTTAEYGGKYRNPADPEPIHITSAKDEPGFQESGEVSKRHDVKNVSGVDDSALFAGTIYETTAKANAAISISKPSFKTSWLEKEGFQTLRQALAPSESGLKKPEVSMEVKATAQSPRIEPALDRVKASDVKLRNKQEGIKRRELSIPSDTVEDLDLLRASDVRAATRSARMTRLEIEQSKQETRKNLDTNYSKHQLFGAAKFAINAETAKEKVSRSLSSVWEHMKQYPQGIVAKTIGSMGIFNGNYNTYERLNRPAQDSTERLLFKDETLSKSPSIYKKVGKRSTKPLRTFTPSQEVIDVERAERARSAFVRQVNEESKNRALIEREQVGALAVDIRNAYEEQYGKIDINHRQAAATSHNSADTISAPAPSRTDLTEFRKPAAALQSMGPATIKPGVEEDPVIKNHVSVFEPKLAKIVDDAKSARKAIHEAKLEVMAMRSRRPQTIWSSRSTAVASMSVPKPEPLRIEPALDRSTEKQPSEATIKPAESLSSPNYTSEYIVLAYNSSSNSVTASPLDSSMSSAQESGLKTSVPQILASLNHTAKFLSHFASLSSQGYEVVSGGGDVLLFKKRSMKVANPHISPLLTHVKAIIDKNKLAVQEAAAQPVANVVSVKTLASPGNVPVKEAATVLDEIPAPEPRPGPAGPTAPPMGPPSYMRPKVRRQEDVFSASKASRVSPPPAASAEKKPTEDCARENPKIQVGIWTRFKRGVKRVVLTAAAMGAGAYTIGAVAESLGAQHPPEKAISGGRPGIYSTENSR
jgi:hypothetical protein